MRMWMRMRMRRPRVLGILMFAVAARLAGMAEGLPDNPPASFEISRSHWAFQPIRRPAVPLTAPGADHRAVESPVDAFVLAELAEKGFVLRPQADRRTLARRLFFDLTGLPPSPEEVARFASDPDRRAYLRLVDRLLESPHYGERWGRHWLDVAGYAESSMFIGDIPRQGFWRYRDYVIRSLNSDKPYDQFLIEQLAGDELFNWRSADDYTPEQVDLLAATGFLRCTPDATDNQAITQMDKRYIAQQTAVEVSMKAVMGLTVNCVRCHDHKFDPIKQEEYYRLIAVFQPVYDPDQWLPGIWSSGNPGPLRAIPLLPGQERRAVMAEAAAWFDERLSLAEQMRIGIERPYRDSWLRERLAEISGDADRGRVERILEIPAEKRRPSDDEFCSLQARELGLTEARIKELFPQVEEAKTKVRARLKEIEQRNKEVFNDVIWAAFDSTTRPTSTRLLLRGNYETPGREVAPGVIDVLDAPERSPRFGAAPGDWTSGRRLALARWLVHPTHPLVARVMVNRIWQYHFGAGIVATPDDFGTRGAPPASQPLLDWLATELIESGWSIKHLHRLIVNSATYRQQSVVSQSESPWTKLDAGEMGGSMAAFVPQPRRLEAGVIRDSMLEVSGRLDKRLFGPSIPTERRPDGSFDIKSDHPDRFRRSIYIHTRRTFVPTFLTLFDEPQMDTNWPRRSTSAIAQQALALMNDPFVIESARAFASRVQTEAGPSFELALRRAFALAYQREPSADELAAFRESAGGHDNPWPIICQALLSSNEFLYID